MTEHLESGDLLGTMATSMGTTAVRAARRADATAIAAIQARSWRHSYSEALGEAALNALDDPALAKAWRNAITDPPSPAHRVLVATTGTNVVGFAALAGIEIAALVVDPGQQRRGHGSRLLAAMVDSLREAGLHRVQTWVLQEDAPLLAFYAGAGMQPDGARRVYDQTEPSADRPALLTELRVAAALD